MVPHPTRISVAALALFHFLFSTKKSKLRFDHSFDHNYPGVAQLVGRLIWVLGDRFRHRSENIGTSPETPQISPLSPLESSGNLW